MKVEDEIVKAWEELKKKKDEQNPNEEDKEDGEEEEIEKREKGEEENEEEKEEEKSKERIEENTPIETSSMLTESIEIKPPILESSKVETSHLEEIAIEEGAVKRERKKQEETFYEKATYKAREEYERGEIKEIITELKVTPTKMERIVMKDGMQEIMEREMELIPKNEWQEIIEVAEIKTEELAKKYEYEKYKSMKLESEIEKAKKYKIEG